MSFKLRTHLQRSGDAVARPVGVKELQARPPLGNQVSLEHNRIIETGRVERIKPPNCGSDLARVVVARSPDK